MSVGCPHNEEWTCCTKDWDQRGTGCVTFACGEDWNAWGCGVDVSVGLKVAILVDWH